MIIRVKRSPQTCLRRDKRWEGFETEREALRLEMRQRDVRQARVVTLRHNGPNLWEDASRLSMGTCLICRENNSTTKLVQNSNKSFRARRIQTNRGVFNYLRRLHIHRDYTERKTGGIVGTKCEYVDWEVFVYYKWRVFFDANRLMSVQILRAHLMRRRACFGWQIFSLSEETSWETILQSITLLPEESCSSRCFIKHTINSLCPVWCFDGLKG